jgi:hypothetical protein
MKKSYPIVWIALSRGNHPPNYAIQCKRTLLYSCGVLYNHKERKNSLCCRIRVLMLLLLVLSRLGANKVIRDEFGRPLTATHMKLADEIDAHTLDLHIGSGEWKKGKKDV